MLLGGGEIILGQRFPDGKIFGDQLVKMVCVLVL